MARDSICYAEEKKMIAAFVLIAGVLLVMMIGSGVLVWIGSTQILPTLVPLGPWLVMVGTFLLILTELLLLFGSKEDRRAAMRDFGYLIPTLIVSGGLWYITQRYLW